METNCFSLLLNRFLLLVWSGLVWSCPAWLVWSGQTCYVVFGLVQSSPVMAWFSLAWPDVVWIALVGLAWLDWSDLFQSGSAGSGFYLVRFGLVGLGSFWSGLCLVCSLVWSLSGLACLLGSCRGKLSPAAAVTDHFLSVFALSKKVERRHSG